jgi:hypothetical protein
MKAKSVFCILVDSINKSKAMRNYTFVSLQIKSFFYVATIRRKTRGAEAVGQHMARGTFQALPGHRVPQVQNISSSSGTQSFSGTEYF